MGMALAEKDGKMVFESVIEEEKEVIVECISEQILAESRGGWHEQVLVKLEDGCALQVFDEIPHNHYNHYVN